MHRARAQALFRALTFGAAVLSTRQARLLELTLMRAIGCMASCAPLTALSPRLIPPVAQVREQAPSQSIQQEQSRATTRMHTPLIMASYALLTAPSRSSTQQDL